MKNKFSDLRDEIDSLDEQILALLNRRAEAAAEIGLIKKKNGDALYVPSREQAVIARLTSMNQGPLSHASVCAIFSEIMSSSLALEQHDHVLSGGADEKMLRYATDFVVGRCAELELFETREELAEAVQKRKESVVIICSNWLDAVVNGSPDLVWAGCRQLDWEARTELIHFYRRAARPDAIRAPISIYCLVDLADKRAVLNEQLLTSAPVRSVEGYEVGNDTQSSILRFRLQTDDPREVTRLVGEIAQKCRFVWTA